MRPRIPASVRRLVLASRLGLGTLTGVQVATDAVTGALRGHSELAEATRRAGEALGGPVQLVQMSMGWRFVPQSSAQAFGADRPVSWSYSFYRRDQPSDVRNARVLHDVSMQSGAPVVGVSSQGGARPAAAARVDLDAVFRQVEAAGGSSCTANGSVPAARGPRTRAPRSSTARPW